MGKKKAVDFDPRKLSPQEKLKFEIAQELGLDSKVMEGGWRSLTADHEKEERDEGGSASQGRGVGHV